MSYNLTVQNLKNPCTCSSGTVEQYGSRSPSCQQQGIVDAHVAFCRRVEPCWSTSHRHSWCTPNHSRTFFHLSIQLSHAHFICTHRTVLSCSQMGVVDPVLLLSTPFP